MATLGRSFRDRAKSRHGQLGGVTHAPETHRAGKLVVGDGLTLRIACHHHHVTLRDIEWRKHAHQVKGANGVARQCFKTLVLTR